MPAQHKHPQVQHRTELFGDGPRLLLVASTGGHLAQLARFAEREGARADSLWVTFDSPQSRSLLEKRERLWVDYVAPRDVRGTFRAYKRIEQHAKPRDFDGVLTTGAAVGLAGLWWARRHRIPAAYVESISRTDGPSLTGRIVHALRLAPTFTQHERWATKRWHPIEPVLSQFSKQPRDQRANAEQPLTMLVTLGTIKPYRFDSLVEQISHIARPDDQITWQLGVTTLNDLPGESHELVPADELLRLALDADVVITHAGVGTILQFIEHGISPVVVPRRHERGEHVDDHQLQIWRLLERTGIAHPVEVEDLTREVLAEAASHKTVGLAQQ